MSTFTKMINEVTIAITNFCNAGCPQCHRTDRTNVSKKVSWLPDEVWSLEKFKKAVPPNMVRDMKTADFCGTWGDPITNNDLIGIVEYHVKENPKIKAKKVRAYGHGLEDPGFKLLANFIKTGLPVTFAIVIGKKIKADANMIGMPPPAFNFKGK